MNGFKIPVALFDDADNITKTSKTVVHRIQKIELQDDYLQVVNFLKSYRGSIGTFNSYRREIEKLLHWSWNVAKKSIKDLKRDNIEQFIIFCQKPPKTWISLKKSVRFINQDGLRISNPNWRPFVATVSKSEFRKGKKPNINTFHLSNDSIKECFAILSSFFNYLIQEEYLFMNPIATIRQKSKFMRKRQGSAKIRRLSELQWKYIIKVVNELADNDPELHERTLFMMTALYSMYLRISEISASKRWNPCMNHFQRDSNGNWWFTTVGKGNKERQIAVSNSMLAALKRYRKHLGLSPLPSPADNSPLFPKIKGQGSVSNSTYIRTLVQKCFDNAISKLTEDNYLEEAEALNEATVHWLRHTGISDDVKHRPREHVREDAGHSSSAITDKYIDIELQERHKSAKNKLIVQE